MKQSDINKLGLLLCSYNSGSTIENISMEIFNEFQGLDSDVDVNTFNHIQNTLTNTSLSVKNRLLESADILRGIDPSELDDDVTVADIFRKNSESLIYRDIHEDFKGDVMNCTVLIDTKPPHNLKQSIRRLMPPMLRGA